MKTIHLVKWMAALAALIYAAPLYASSADARIEFDAKNSYVFKNYLKDDPIEVRAIEGVVTLTGSVAEEHHRSFAELTVALIPGVKQINNRITIKGGEEARLVTVVKSALMFNRNVNAGKTKVEAEHGVVTLRGEAASEAERDLIARYAKEVNGVVAVINRMTVATNGAKNIADTTGAGLKNIE